MLEFECLIPVRGGATNYGTIVALLKDASDPTDLALTARLGVISGIVEFKHYIKLIDHPADTPINFKIITAPFGEPLPPPAYPNMLINCESFSSSQGMFVDGLGNSHQQTIFKINEYLDEP